jgi:hypothetical protein
MTEPYERLKQTLIDNGEAPLEAESLAALSILLDAAPQPVSKPDHKAQLLRLLSAELPEPKSRLDRFAEWYPLALMHSQLRVIQREIWLASALVLLLGVVVTLLAPKPDSATFTVLAPLVAAVGVAMLYDHDSRMMLEIEETTRASARLLLLARLTLVYGFNLVLALIGSIVLAIFDADISLIPLIASWLAPMTFLSGLGFFLSIVLNDTLAASMFSLLLWVIHTITDADSNGNFILYLLTFPGLSDPSNRPFLMFTAALLILVALWIVGIKERQIGQIA